jgi:DNA-binding transcriptional LysR family regulator
VDSVVTDPDCRIPQAVAGIEKRYPQVRFELRHGSPQTLQTGVLDGELHVAVGSFPHKVRGLVYRHIYTETNTLHCGRGHPMFDLPMEEITSETVRTYKVAGRTYWRPDHANNQFFSRTTATAAGVEQQLLLILSGAYLGYVPDHAAKPWIKRGTLRRLRPDLFRYTCPFDVVTRPQVSRGALAEAFLEDLFEVYGLLDVVDKGMEDPPSYIDDHQPFD